MCALLSGTVISSLLSGAFSVVYLFHMGLMAPALAVPALLIILLQIAVMVAAIYIQAGIVRKQIDVAAELNGMVYRLFSGIQKIKLAGAERRPFWESFPWAARCCP